MATYHLATGLKDLKALIPELPDDDIEEYFVEVLDSTDTVVITTPHFHVGGCCDGDKVRFFFQTAGGVIDGINGQFYTEEFDVKAEVGIRNNTANPINHAQFKTSVKANETRRIVFQIMEEEMTWFKEFLSSPLVWVANDANTNYVPVMVVDGKQSTRKFDERYDYQFEVDIQFSNEYKTLRS